MRDAVNYCLPMVRNPLDGLNGPNGVAIANIAGNGYYGYLQPVREGEKIEDNATSRTETTLQKGQRRDDFGTCPMEIEGDEKRAPGNRKRAWEYGGEGAFKKRRQTVEKLRLSRQDETTNLLEELLANTHGCNSYHWNGHDL